MSSAIVKRTELRDMVSIADALAGAGPMLPKHIACLPEPARKAATLAVIMTGDELGVPPMAALRGMFILNGKVGMDYSLMVGLLIRAGYKVVWKEKGGTRAELHLTSPTGDTHTEVWDIARAKTAKLWGKSGPWTDYPEAMFTARCVSSAARAFAADVLAGCYASEEEIYEVTGGDRVVTVGGSDVHVGEVIAPEQTYEDPKQADEKSRVKAISAGWIAKNLPTIEEHTKCAIAEMLECVAITDEEIADAERKAITKAHRYTMGEWVREHGDMVRETFKHPATSSNKKSWWDRMRKWCDASKVPLDDLKAMMADESAEGSEA